jgi:hypothetical protein
VSGAGEQALRRAADVFAAALGDRLLAAYALGSLAHGGFSELVSDIDLGLIIDDPLRGEDAAVIDSIAMRVRGAGALLDSRLSVFWGTPATLRGELEGGRFPALDRLDLIDHGRRIAGSDEVRRGLARPDGPELLRAGAKFALERLSGSVSESDPASAVDLRSAEPVDELLCPELLLAGGIRKVTKVVLFPVRFLFTAKTGRIGTNDESVESYLAESAAPSQPLVAAAHAWRQGPRDWEVQAAELLPQQIMPLYRHYLEDHIVRLERLGEHELARGFEDWRQRLTARS